ncbi:DUF4389 domain-containing protein [Actinomadura luteofluorescens]|uniref:DUF4389 domain-containing protein n=1 Tax=Actinomadura luteofluorescens TaxID=46163 RepID=UPI00362CD187
MKVVNRELAGEPAFLARFRREVTAARRVHRFCTAPVIDAELDQDPPYIVTEYIDGPSLEKAVSERGPLPGSDLEGLAVGVATALAAIHGAGIVHRDLKPANVLLSSTGPRVIDFGIARALDAADGPTRTGQFVGTPSYIAPEVLRGEPVEQASDVFSWGCVVAYAGTGRPRSRAAPSPRRSAASSTTSPTSPAWTRGCATSSPPRSARTRATGRRRGGCSPCSSGRRRPTSPRPWRRSRRRGGGRIRPRSHPPRTRRPAAVEVPAPRPAPEAPAPAPAVREPGPGEETVLVDLPFPAAWRGPRRWLTLLRGLLVVPHLVVMLLMYAALVVVMLLSWLVIPFTGRYPRALYALVVGCQRWSSRVVAYAFGLTGEKLPPFRTLPRARRTH